MEHESGFGRCARRGVETIRLAHLAIVNPPVTPYAAAVDTMQAFGALQALRPECVQAENIAQTYQFVGMTTYTRTVFSRQADRDYALPSPDRLGIEACMQAWVQCKSLAVIAGS